MNQRYLLNVKSFLILKTKSGMYTQMSPAVLIRQLNEDQVGEGRHMVKWERLY